MKQDSAGQIHIQARKDGYLGLSIRISDHPITKTIENQYLLCIGNHSDAQYSLTEWYKVLLAIGNDSRCVEIKALSAKFTAEAALKNKHFSENFQNTLENIRKKAARRACPSEAHATTEKEIMEVLGRLLTGFAARFNINMQASVIPTGNMFRLQYNTWRPAYVIVSRYKLDTPPQDCQPENMILVGTYGTVFRRREWENILRATLSKVGLTEKTHRKTLEQFIKKKCIRGLSTS